MPRPSRPVTVAMFGKLAADLRDELADATVLEREALLARPRQVRPRAFRNRPWVKQRIGLRDAADPQQRGLREVATFTGLAYNSLRVYRSQGAKDRAGGTETYRSMPAESTAEGGGWTLGSLALWLATRQPGRAKGAAHGFMRGGRWPDWETYLPALHACVDPIREHGGRIYVSAVAEELGIERALATRLLDHIGAGYSRGAQPGASGYVRVRTASDEDALAFLKEAAARGDRRITSTGLRAELAAAGMPMHAARVARLYLSAGGRLLEEGPADGPDPAPGESMRSDGLLGGTEVARMYGCSPQHVTAAREPRTDGLPPLIVPAKWENGRPLYDPATLTYRRDMHVGPVCKGHPLAAELGALRRGIARERRAVHSAAQQQPAIEMGLQRRRRPGHMAGLVGRPRLRLGEPAIVARQDPACSRGTLPAASTRAGRQGHPYQHQPQPGPRRDGGRPGCH